MFIQMNSGLLLQLKMVEVHMVLFPLYLEIKKQLLILTPCLFKSVCLTSLMPSELFHQLQF